MDKCSLCERVGDDEYFEDHHLYPGKKRRKKVKRVYDTIRVCLQCGDQIHRMFTNDELRNGLDSLQALKDNMGKYIKHMMMKVNMLVEKLM